MMSTKIYTGFRLDLDNLFAIHAWAQPLRSQIAEKILQAQQETALAKVYSLLDRDALRVAGLLAMPTHNDGEKTDRFRYIGTIFDPEGRDSSLSYWRRAVCAVYADDADMTEISSGSKNPQERYKCELFLYPHDKKVYGMYFGGAAVSNILDELMRTAPHVTSFAYWNNTDRPDEVSTREWNKRRNIWEAILNNSNASDQSMMFNLAPARCDIRALSEPNNTVWDAQAPSFDKRVRAAAMDCPEADLLRYADNTANFAPIMRRMRELEQKQDPVFEQRVAWLAQYLPAVPDPALWSGDKDVVQAYFQQRLLALAVDAAGAPNTRAKM